MRYHSADWRNLYAALMVHGVGRPFGFHVDAIGEETDAAGLTREGVWWLPKNTTTDYLILTNQGAGTLPLKLSLYDASGKEAKQALTLGPRSMVRYSVRQLVVDAGLSGSYGGIKVSAGAHEGSLDTLHVLFDEQASFSAILKMFDFNPRATIKERDYARTQQWTLRAPMLALANPDPALTFPTGTRLQPQLLIRNNTGKNAEVALRFNWRSASSTGKAAGPALRLNPFETRRVDVAALQDGTTLPKDAQWASVVLTTKGLPGEVMAVAASYDASLKYGAQTPFSDQLSHLWKGGQWESDTVHNSIITVGNGGGSSVNALVRLLYNQGTAKYEMEQALQPDEQMWIDVGKLIRNRVPDKNGNALPAGLTAGSFEVRDLSHTAIGTLFEGKVTSDKTYGHATYGCTVCCGLVGAWMWFDPVPIPVQSTTQSGVDSHDECDNVTVDASDLFGGWNTSNHSIATVNGTGLHSGVAAGATVSTASGEIPRTNRHADCPLVAQNPSGNDNVKPRIDSVTPSIATVGTTINQITIAGGGFGASPTVNLPQGVTVTGGQGSTDSQIILNAVVISTSAPIGPNSLTVTVRGSDGTNQTSNQGGFTLDGPFYMTVVSDQILKCSGCTTAVARDVTYQIKNFSNSNAGTTTIGENPVDSGWNCNQADPGSSFSPCSAGYSAQAGRFTDEWSIGSDGYTPAGCGDNVDDHWMWCPTGRSIGHLSGYIHTNAVSINGVVNPPTSFAAGTVINP